MNQAANLALLTRIVAFFVVYFTDLVGTIGTTAIIAAVIFLSVSLVAGYLLGGPGGGTKHVLVVGLAGLVLLIFAGGELGKRAKTGDVFLERPAVTLRLRILVCTGTPTSPPHASLSRSTIVFCR